LQEVLARWHAHHDGTVTDFKVEAEALQAELTYQRRDDACKIRITNGC
jgi:hypothetical protein